MKKLFKSIYRHRKTIIISACAVTVAAIVFTDAFSLKDSPAVSDYLYTETAKDTEKIKILEEATLVDNQESQADDDSYFTSAVINKEKSRDEALETLQVVVESSNETPDVRDMALTEILEIAANIETEATVEEMVKAKGFEDCVAIISEDTINVIVKSSGLDTSEVAQITDIVKNETGYSAQSIRIIEKK